MKRTGKDIYAFVSKNLEEAKDKLAKIGDGYKHSDRLDTECRMLETKINAYEEVLNFISKEPEVVGTTTVDEAFEKLLLDNCPEVKKKLRAFEIIKEKKVNLEYLKCCETYDQYKTICSYWNEITKEDFDFMKEVLK